MTIDIYYKENPILLGSGPLQQTLPRSHRWAACGKEHTQGEAEMTEVRLHARERQMMKR